MTFFSRKKYSIMLSNNRFRRHRFHLVRRRYKIAFPSFGTRP